MLDVLGDDRKIVGASGCRYDNIAKAGMLPLGVGRIAYRSDNPRDNGVHIQDTIPE